MVKFRFKKGKRSTGLFSVGCPYPDTQIKLGGKEVGIIYAPVFGGMTKEINRQWRVFFAIEKQDGNCPFTWIRLKKGFDTEQEARSAAIKFGETIGDKYKFFNLNRDQ